MQLAIAQLNQRVGDLAANARGILDAVAEAERGGAALVVTPSQLPRLPRLSTGF